MEPQYIHIYSGRTSALTGNIDEDGRLHLTSEVYGEDYDSEKHYEFTKEETDRLFSIISLEDFIALCSEQHLIGMEGFLSDNQIRYDSFTF